MRCRAAASEGELSHSCIQGGRELLNVEEEHVLIPLLRAFSGKKRNVFLPFNDLQINRSLKALMYI